LGWLIEAEKRGVKKVYGRQLDKKGFLLEPNKNHLEEILRSAYKSTGEIVRKGINGVLRVRKNWTWKHSAVQLLSRIDSLCGTTMGVNAQKGFGDVPEDAVFIVKAIEQKDTEHG
jgi:hypothetical protein